MAQDVCIDDKAKKALACDGVAAATDASKLHTGIDFHGVAPIAKPKESPKAVPNVDMPRDDRKIRLAARQLALLVTEVQQVENLLKNTKKGAADRMAILRRLADDYVEVESAAFRDKTEAEIKRDGFKRTKPQEASQQQAKVDESDRALKAARKNAIQSYKSIVDDYPTAPQIDEVLYYLAYEYEQAQDAKSARTVYYDLIQKAPNSKYIPNAYLAFGELFFNEAQGDPSKWELAAKAYAEVTKYPAPGDKVLAYAHYKAAYVYWNKGELDRALDQFKKTIDVGVANPQMAGFTKLAEAARHDLIPVYALKGDPTKAYGFFHGVTNDVPKTYAMMDDLGVHYIDTGHYPEGITLYRDLIAKNKSGDLCAYQGHVTDATMALKSSDKDAIRTELDKQVAAYQKSNGEKTCANRTASLVTETAMAWHLEAVGTEKQRGTGDTKTMDAAAALYKRVVDTFDAKQMASFEYPRLVKEDWPTLFKVKYEMADLLYSEKSWAKCGPAFDAVVNEDPKGPEAAKAAYAAALCYQNVYEGAHQNGAGHQLAGVVGNTTSARAKLEPKEIKAEQRAMLTAFDRYVCVVKSEPAQLVEVKYARARTYFEAQHWDEAAQAFRDIAINHATSDSAPYAAQLYLESAYVLYKHFDKVACEGEMTSDVVKLLELHCGADKHTETCTNLEVVQVDLMRLRAERMVKKADSEKDKDAIADYQQGAQIYFELFRQYCQEPVSQKKKPIAEKCDEIAYNAAKAFQAARLLAKAIVARKALLAFDEAMSAHSPLAKKAAYEIGANYQAIAVYDAAAEWYESYARSDARAENADKALSDAVLLRLGLGQEEKAIEDAAAYAKSHGATKPKEVAMLGLAIAGHHAEKGDWEKARAALASVGKTLDRAPTDVQLQAHATLGRALAKLNRLDQAKTEYARVRALYPNDIEAKIQAAYPNEDATLRDRRLRKAVEAMGEALFFAAEQRRVAEVETLKFPEYKGAGDKVSVKAHVDTKVKDWYVKKMAAIEKVEAEYAKILGLLPLAPPRWVIAAGYRAGLLWGDFVDDFRRAPIPKAWRGTEVEQVYTTAIDLASQPYKDNHAKPALVKCLELSVRVQFFDDYSRACEVWLAKNYKQEYHVVDELRSAPTLANTALGERTPPVRIITSRSDEVAKK